MIRLARYTLAAALAVGLLAITPVAPAHAAQVNMCSPTASGTSPGPRRWTAPGSGTVYGLNNAGCVLLAPADVPDARAAGFTLRSQLFSAAVTLSAAGTLIIPGGTYIDRIVVQETSGASITGGLKIGTASGGTQVAAALICGSSCLVWTPDASISTRIFATTAPQTLFIDAVSSWNSAQAVVTVVYGYY